jgi:3-oxoacyl-(acyl-carrier-protein) synthase
MGLPSNRRVVITGMATINPLGDTLDGYYANLIRGKSGVKRWESLDVSGIECKVGGDIGNYDCAGALERLQEKLPEETRKKVRKQFKTATFSCKTAMLCALEAYADAGLLGKDIDPYKVSCLVAGHNLNSNYMYGVHLQYLKEPAFIDGLAGVEAIDPNVPASVSEALGVKGPTFTIGGACASGNLVLRDAMRDIVSGECDRSVVTGALFDVSAADIHASVIINAVVTRPEFQEHPERASRPFDKKRCGFVYSHGAGTLVLEELEAARGRGARIYAELLGAKASSNACHLPMPSGDEQGRVIRSLLEAVRVRPEEVDYVNCHATGTPSGDLEEIKAIKAAFKDHAYRLKHNAPKSMLGHVAWSAPIVEMIGGILQMRGGMLHPTINIDEQDPEIDLDICANKAVKHHMKYMLKNSFGFGGLNCCSLVKRFEE